MSATATAPTGRKVQEVESITIRFAGDSGDGMQLAGTQFTNVSAILGNDIATFPDFPAEIRSISPRPTSTPPATGSTA
jgi:2-oxoglutarate ferredoxin oxidoreductase subunit alpha